jgi:hypothetical protein
MTVADTAAVPSELSEPIPLSLNQEFLCVFDKGDAHGAFGNGHTLVHGWRVTGPVDVDTLQGALDDVVERHETLRSTIVREQDRRYQVVHPATSPELVVHDLSGTAPTDRDRRAEEFLNDLDASPFSVRELPHLKAILGRFDDNDAVLVIIVHHTATDGWSNQLLLHDVAALYAARSTGTEPDLPPVHQYGEFAGWQLENLGSPATGKALAYWKDKLQGAQILAVRADRPRDMDLTNAYAVHRFLIDAELTEQAVAFAKFARSSPFIVLVAAYNLLLHNVSGAGDVVVPTFTSGRYEERFMATVGPFFNFVPLRTNVGACGTFREVVDATRATCLEALSHDIPFAVIANDSPELTAPFADPGLAVIAFELLQSPSAKDSEQVGDLTYSEIRQRTLSQERSSHIPDGALWAMDVLPNGEIAGSLKYDTNLFDESTMVGLVTEFSRVLRAGVTTPNAPLRQS